MRTGISFNHTCYTCGRIIKGEAVFYNPPTYLRQLGVDFPKAFHPKCYEREEREAEKELRGEK